MIIKETMCHSTFLIMLSKTKKLEQAIWKYSATSPDHLAHGIRGYIETEVEFHVKDLNKFTELYNFARNKTNSKIYWIVESGKLFENE